MDKILFYNSLLIFSKELYNLAVHLCNSTCRTEIVRTVKLHKLAAMHKMKCGKIKKKEKVNQTCEY